MTRGSLLLRGALTGPEISHVWHRFRLYGSSLTLATLVIAGVVMDWPGAFIVAGLAVVVLVDAVPNQRKKGSVVLSLILDTTLIGVAMVVVELTAAGIAGPFIYVSVVPLLVLPVIRGLPLLVYGAAWAIAALTTDAVLAPPAAVDLDVVAALSFGIFTTLLLMLVITVSNSLAQGRERAVSEFRSQEAMTVAAQLLLTESGPNALTGALEALREASDADAAFVGENSGDRVTGPAAEVRQVGAADDGAFVWKLPYVQHWESAADLAKGNAARLDDALGLVIDGEDPVTAIAVPVTVGGEWAGFLGLAKVSDDGFNPDMRMLETVARMVGSFIERRSAYDRLEQLIQSKDRFLASVGHEIRNPLTSVLGFASLLRDGGSDMEGIEVSSMVEMIEQQAQDVSDLVEDLLVAARGDIDAVKVMPRPVVMATEIDGVVRSRIMGDGKDVFVASSPEHVALADPTRLRQIVRNLLTNALRYGGDQITITTHRDGPNITMVFSDNGPGVPPEMGRRIFDPYYRGEAGMARAESVGLGLSVSRQLARLMNGDLMLRSDLGPATFQLDLPAAPRTTEGDETPLDVEPALSAEKS